MSTGQQKGWKMKRIVLCGLFLFLIPTLSSGQEYPTKSINIMVNFPAGGTTDLSTRILASKAEKFLGQPFIISNVGGGGGAVGLGVAVKEKPDGYHLVSCSSMGLTWHPHIRALPYTYQDFVYILSFVTSQTGIVVRSDSPWKTLKELIEYAKKNPGKVTYSTAGANSPAHIFTEYLGKKEGIQWTHIPYPGAAPAIVALLGSHIHFYNGGEEWLPYIRSQELRLLASVTEKRRKTFPEVPTMRELGYDLINISKYLVCSPKGTSLPIIKKLEEAFRKAMDDPEFIQTISKMDMEVTHLNSEDSEKFIIESYNYHKKLIAELNLAKEPEKKK
jgi:tripartite-type tricarboxylate transporter receptor subunit TctC